MRRFARSFLLPILLGFFAVPASAQSSLQSPDQKNLLSTGVTGSVGSSGLDDPQYVLSFVPVQRLMLTATQRPLKIEEIDSALEQTPVRSSHLLNLELLRKEGEVYRLNYLLLTAKDQEEMFRISQRLGESLANAFLAKKSEFDALAARYPNPALRPQLLFGLVAGAALNWGGLELTTELGYRVQAPRHANGNAYLVHSSEDGAHLDFTGLYFDSQTAPGSVLMFSTFGDGKSLPRLQGMPDVFDGLEAAMENWKKLPDVYKALRNEYITLLLLAIDDAGRILNAVAQGADTQAAIAKSVEISDTRVKSMLALLSSIGYVRESSGHFSIDVPVLTERDKGLVDGVLALSREIMSAWLKQNYPAMQQQLSGLSPMRNGLPFTLVFSEVWHYEFGFAAKSLAESGFFANPRAKGNRHEGYVPLVWSSGLLKMPGS